MREGAGQSFGGREFVLRRVLLVLRRDGEFAQDSIDERSGGALAGAFHQFDAFVESGALRNAIEPAELIEGEAQGDENFEFEFGKGLRGGGGDFVVQARTPAENAHDEFGGECVIGSGEALVGRECRRSEA